MWQCRKILTYFFPLTVSTVFHWSAATEVWSYLAELNTALPWTTSKEMMGKRNRTPIARNCLANLSVTVKCEFLKMDQPWSFKMNLQTEADWLIIMHIWSEDFSECILQMNRQQLSRFALNIQLSAHIRCCSPFKIIFNEISDSNLILKNDIHLTFLHKEKWSYFSWGALTLGSCFWVFFAISSCSHELVVTAIYPT